MDGPLIDQAAVNAINDMLSLFGGEDGGGGYMTLRRFVNKLQNEPNNAASQEILGRIVSVNRLCKAILEGKVKCD